MLRRTLLAGLVAALPTLAMAQAAKPDPQNTLAIDLKDGRVLIELLPNIAPKHAERLKTLTKRGFYDNIVFHRVIDGFMAQTGDVQHGNMDKGFDAAMAGTGGSSLPDIPAEFTDKEGFVRGTVGMARSQNPDSANSQFFIMFAPGEFLNGQYTIIGNVTEGMERVDNITKGDQANNGAVATPDKMVSVKIAADN